MVLGTLPENLHKAVDTLWLKLTTSLLSRLGRPRAVESCPQMRKLRPER